MQIWRRKNSAFYSTSSALKWLCFNWLSYFDSGRKANKHQLLNKMCKHMFDILFFTFMSFFVLYFTHVWHPFIIWIFFLFSSFISHVFYILLSLCLKDLWHRFFTSPSSNPPTQFSFTSWTSQPTPSIIFHLFRFFFYAFFSDCISLLLLSAY